MFNLGASEIAVVLVVALLFLGPKMLPEIATALGKIIREFRKATADIRQDIELDDVIRKPLQELRDAATLPPEELKRRDEAKAAQRKAELAAKEEAERKEREAQEAARKEREAKAAAEAAAARQKEMEKAAAAIAAVLPQKSGRGEAVTTGGTMIASPPPAEDLQTLTPLPDLHSPPPLLGHPALPPPPPPPPLPRPTRPSAAAMNTVSDATVIDLHAQLKASAAANATVVGRPASASSRTAPAPAPQKSSPTLQKPSDKSADKGKSEAKNEGKSEGKSEGKKG